MNDASTEQMTSQLRPSRDSEADKVLDFWREHGRVWALEEGAPEDAARVAKIAEAAGALPPEEAAQHVQTELMAVWRKGFAKSTDAYGWDEMGDQLPPSALLAFARGVQSAQVAAQDRM
ncbi:MAG TPA: hypothetical protein VG942_05510 [Hyphomonadaceae bacterium]|nr:hypothetical protein [Hyphomonadaceae bacterium]